MKIALALFVAAGLLTGCIPQSPATALPTAITLAEIPAVAASPVSVATALPTPRPTSTKMSTETSDPPLLTQEAMVSSCAATERTWYTKHLSDTYFTQENWGAVVCSDNGIYTRITNESLDIDWTVPAFDDDLNTPEPSWYWQPYLWSDDGKYLYLQPTCLCFIDSPWLIYASGFGLSRLDLSTGQFDIWLKPSDNPWYTFSFSENEKLFAFSPNEFPGTIKIRDLTSENYQELSFKEKYSILEYRWTPDGSRLIILTEEMAEDKSQSGFSIFVYSMKSRVLKKVVDKNNLNSTFPTEEFIEPRIYISGFSNEALFLSDVFQENNFKLNIRTGELINVNKSLTPTPTR